MDDMNNEGIELNKRWVERDRHFRVLYNNNCICFPGFNGAVGRWE